MAGETGDRELARMPDGVTDRHRRIMISRLLIAGVRDPLAVRLPYLHRGQPRHRTRARRDRRSPRDQEREPVQDPRVSQRRGNDRAPSRRVAALAPANGWRCPGIGKDLAAKIGELVDTGAIAYHQELLQEFPPTILDLLHLQGVGPKTVALLYRHLGSARSTISRPPARDGRLRDAEGHGREEGGADPAALEERTASPAAG